MTLVTPNILFTEVIEFLASGPSTEEILAFQPSEELAERSHYLLECNRSDTITADERDELEEFRRMNHFMNMLKIRTRQKLAA